MWASRSNLSLHDIYNALTDDLPKISPEDKDILVRPVTVREVCQTLKSMAKGKSMDPNGLNVEFDLYYWNVVGKHLYIGLSIIF